MTKFSSSACCCWFCVDEAAAAAEVAAAEVAAAGDVVAALCLLSTTANLLFRPCSSVRMLFLFSVVDAFVNIVDRAARLYDIHILGPLIDVDDGALHLVDTPFVLL